MSGDRFSCECDAIPDGCLVLDPADPAVLAAVARFLQGIPATREPAGYAVGVAALLLDRLRDVSRSQ